VRLTSASFRLSQDNPFRPQTGQAINQAAYIQAPSFGNLFEIEDWERDHFDQALDKIGQYEKFPDLTGVQNLVTQITRSQRSTRQTFLDRLLLNALSHENFLLLNLLLKAGADPNGYYHFREESQYMLQRAISAGNADGMSLLAKYGAKLENDFQDPGGLFSAYLFSLSKGKTDLARLAVALGAREDWADESGQNALFYWSTFHEKDEVKRLLDAGLSVNGVTAYGGRTLVSTFLPWLKPTDPLAQEVLQKMAPDRMIEENARVLWEDLLEENAFEPPTEMRARWVETLLKNGLSVQDDLGAGGTPFLMAVKEGHRDAVNVLLKAGSSVSAKNLAGENAFLLALKSGNLFLLNDLRLNRVPVNVPDAQGLGALHHAAETDYFKAFEKLTDAEKEVFQVKTPYDLAEKTFAFLMSLKTFDMNKPDNLGNTPLMRAIRTENLDAMMAILKWNPEISQRNFLGKNAMDLAQMGLGGNFAGMADPISAKVYMLLQNYIIKRV
jgi:ankyrin repeat protein